MTINNEDNDVERTEILYGAENIINKVLETFPNAHKTIDACYDPFVLSVVVSNELLMNAAWDFVHRGGKIRIVTEISNDNITACKEMMKIADVRHLEGIRSTFAISEKEYFGHVTDEPNGQNSHAIYSNVKNYVDSQQYLFEALWKKAIPSKQRIREIEQGVKREVFEVIRDPAETQKISYDLIKSAKREILIIFSTTNVFYRQIKEASAFLELLKETATSSLHRVKVRILAPAEQKSINEMASQLKDFGILVRNYKKPLQATTLTTLVVDQAHSLTVELQDDTKETSDEATGLATYSNSESTALSYVSIFETLWLQNEIHPHNKEKRNRKKCSPP